MKHMGMWLAALIASFFVFGALPAAAHAASPAHHSDTRWVQMKRHMHDDHVTMKHAWHLPVGFPVTNPDGKKVPLAKGESYYSRYFGPSLKQQLAEMTAYRDSWRKLANDRGATIHTLNGTIEGLKTTVHERDVTITARDATIAHKHDMIVGRNWAIWILAGLLAGLAIFALVRGRYATGPAQAHLDAWIDAHSHAESERTRLQHELDTLRGTAPAAPLRAR